MQLKKTNIISEMNIKDENCKKHLLTQEIYNRDKRIRKLLKELAVKDNVERIN